MTTASASSLVVPAQAPQSTRGAVHIVIGRGETPAVYERFAHRLAADGYAVKVPAEGVPVSIEPQSGPVFVVGADTGALRTVEIVSAEPGSVQGLVLVGLPGHDDPNHDDLSFDAEVEARASCPRQQNRLRGEEIVQPGTFSGNSVPAVAVSVLSDVPVLALHGADDSISPLTAALPRYQRLGVERLTVVDRGRHDVLNSIHHRSVAAAIVTFLEQVLAGGPEAAPLRQVDSTTGGVPQ